MCDSDTGLAMLTVPGIMQDLTGTVVPVAAMYDIQIKRIHEYKRQHLVTPHSTAQALQAQAAHVLSCIRFSPCSALRTAPGNVSLPGLFSCCSGFL